MSFAKNKKKIAYASSIGTSHIPVKYEALVKDHLLSFQHIGVREETAVVVLNSLTERSDIVQVLDPTFLLSYNDWQDLAATAKIEIDLPEKYILCYCVGARDNYQLQLNEIKERLNNHNIIHIPAIENPNFMLDGVITYKNAGAKEFIKLLLNAEYVCTDSFHASALSINLSKNFITLLRFDNNDNASQNSRIFDMLTHYNLANRIFSTENILWSCDIDFNPVQHILEIDRARSINFLTNAIEA